MRERAIRTTQPPAPFGFARTPKIIFGAGESAKAADEAAGFGGRVLVVTGRESYATTDGWRAFESRLADHGVEMFRESVCGEPAPEIIDEISSLYRNRGVSCVTGWGGGGAIDAGKAISAMLTVNEPVMNFLEGVGTGQAHPGTKIPYIAVPTTAGTGSEATKNAVISRVGQDGFKKSLRHDNFVPDVAVVDPLLAAVSPPQVAAACAMDAFLQLLESYVSDGASQMTDALAIEGLRRAGQSIDSILSGSTSLETWSSISYAALLSGITLANAGLGVAHGLAGPIGGFFNIPHGVFCATIAASAAEATIRGILVSQGDMHPALAKYSRVSALISDRDISSVMQGCVSLVEKLNIWTKKMDAPKLRRYGVTESDLEKIAAASDSKRNPHQFSREELVQLLKSRL